MNAPLKAASRPTARRKAPSGAVIYRGPSLLTGRPIVAAMTFKSSNVKTGSIPQVWVLVDQVHPAVARRDGRDVSVCGGCPLAGGNGCYVVPNGPGSVYRGLEQNIYGGWPDAERFFQRHAPRAVRLGAYGDPAAVPAQVWAQLETIAGDARLLGYSHQWRLARAQEHRHWCMASVESEADAARAQAKGWRTFRVSLSGEPVDGELPCPAATQGLTCNACRACTGVSSSSAATGRGDAAVSTIPNIVIAAHGGSAVLPKVRAVIEAAAAAAL